MGYLHMRINDEFQRIDANLVCKLCEYFQCEIQDIIEYVKDNE